MLQNLTYVQMSYVFKPKKKGSYTQCRIEKYAIESKMHHSLIIFSI